MKETEMIKQKMMNRLHRRNSSSSSTASVDYSSGGRFEFNFSSLQAIQVPRGWDRLSLSLISVETGKTIAKTGRASTRNGNCQWTETLMESIWVPHDDASKEPDQCLYKLLISMGSGRSGILGEVTVNLSGHLSSDTSISIAQPLKNCSHGTILQLKIQCLTPRTNLRWRDTDSFTEDTNASDDLDNASDASDGRITKSVGSSTSSNFLETSQARRSHRSFDSMDDSFSRESSSPRSNVSEVANDLIGRHDNSYHITSQRQDSEKVSLSIPASPLRAAGPSEFVLEAEGATVEELKAESRMWERSARKLMADLDFARKESRNQKKNLETAAMEILAMQTECDGLKDKISQLKALLDESTGKEKAADTLKLEAQDKDDIQTELQEEMKLNNNLSLQLSKTQESNLELVSLLQELEETLEEKTREIEFERVQNARALSDSESEWEKKLSLKEEEIFNLEERLSKVIGFQAPKEMIETQNLIEVKALKDKIQELERDCNELTDENVELLFKLKESSNNLSMGVASIENSKVVKLKSQIRELKEEAKKRELDGIACDELQSKCIELETQMQVFKDKACHLDGELDKHQAKAEEQENEIAALKQVLKMWEEGQRENSDRLWKDEKIRSKRNYQRDLETQLSNLRILKNQLNGSLKVMKTESTIISECLDKVKNDMVAINNAKESQIAANKILEKKLLELENCNNELELHVAELEQENLHLSERVSGLESQLRYMTDARESNHLEIQHSETRVADLQTEIKRLENEIETGKAETRQKSQEMQNRWLEAQEECEYLKKANPKLQATAEDLIEECASLQKSNRELKQQRLNLNNRCTILESELRDSQHDYTILLKNLKDLEDKFSIMIDSITKKEITFDSELNDLHLQNKEQTEKLVMAEILLDRIQSEKMVEIEKLQQEVSHLSMQISATHDEKDKMASQAVLETHVLRADKEKLEKMIEDNKKRLGISEKKVKTVWVEHEATILELSALKQNHRVLETNLEQLTDLLDKTRSNEEKLRIAYGELDRNLKYCEYERVQLAEEISSLEDQLRKIPLLQEEVVDLKNSINDMKYEKERLEASLHMTTEDYKELKEEKALLFSKTSSMQKAVTELEGYKRNKIELEEKIMRLQGDLTAQEALCAQDADLKNELGRLKRSNSNLRRTVGNLQEERDECLKNVQALEEELERKEVLKPDELENSGSFNNIKLSDDLEASSIDAVSRIRSLEAELGELQERYLLTSLKYAEVEAQKDELLLKLKQSWFS